MADTRRRPLQASPTGYQDSLYSPQHRDLWPDVAGSPVTRLIMMAGALAIWIFVWNIISRMLFLACSAVAILMWFRPDLARPLLMKVTVWAGFAWVWYRQKTKDSADRRARRDMLRAHYADITYDSHSADERKHNRLPAAVSRQSPSNQQPEDRPYVTWDRCVLIYIRTLCCLHTCPFVV